MKPVPALALVLIALAVGFMASRSFGGRAVAEALDRAAAAEAAVAFLVPQRDSIRAANDTLTATVEAAKIAERAAELAADSVARVAASRIAQAGRRASEGADALRASLDSAQAVQLGEIELAWGEVVAANAVHIEALEGQIATLDAGIVARDLLISGVHNELAAERGISAGLQATNAALRAAVRAQGRRALWAQSGTALAVVGLIVMVAR